MSRSRHYPGRSRPRVVKTWDWWAPRSMKLAAEPWDEDPWEYDDCREDEGLDYRRAHRPMSGRRATARQRRKIIYELCYRKWLNGNPDHWLNRSTFSRASKHTDPRFIAAHSREVNKV